MKKLLTSCLLFVLSSSLIFASPAEARGKISYGEEKKIYFDDISFLKGQTKRVSLAESSPPSIDRVQNILSLGNFSGREISDETFSLVGACRGSLQRRGTLEERLEGCPWLAEQIIWETGTGERIPYTRWSNDQKDRLNELFDRLMRNTGNLGIRCPALSEAMSTLGRFYLTAEQAFDIYAAHVAHVFYLEITHRVPWSILNDSPAELEEFLASFRYYSRILPDPNDLLPASIQAGRDFQKSFRERNSNNLTCDPRDGYRFIRGTTSAWHQDLLGETEEQSIENLTWWFHNNVVHAREDQIPSGRERHQYSYLRNRLTPKNGMIPAPEGCHFASNLFYDLAKSINIPLKVVRFFLSDPHSVPERQFMGQITHLGLVFRAERSETLVLPHTDDIYARPRPDFPIRGANPVMPDSREMIRYFFETTWRSPAVLRSWGLEYFDDLPTVTPGTDYGLPMNYLRTDPDYGQLGGYWHSGCSPTDRATGSCLHRAYLNELNYQLCPWTGYLETFCNNRNAFRNGLPVFSIPSLPRSRSVEEILSHAEACLGGATIEAGCEEKRSLVRSWSESFGSNSWEAIPEVPEEFYSPGLPEAISEAATWDESASTTDTPFRPLTERRICQRNLMRDGVDLDTRLSGCPSLANQTVWETPSGERISYTSWPREKKNRLSELFDRIARNERDLGIRCQDPTAPGGIFRYLSEEQAFDIYAAQVAFAYYVETRRLLPWSLRDLTPAQIQELLASYRYHAIVPAYGRPTINGVMRPYQFLPESGYDAVVCDPRTGFRFMQGRNSTLGTNLIGSTPEETLMRLTYWAANALYHDVTRYPGHSRDLPGRLRSVRRMRGENPWAYIPVRDGSLSSANLLHDLARSVNIPLLIAHTTAFDPHDIAANLRRSSGRLYNIFEIADRGLIYQWDTHPLILYNTDLLYWNLPLPWFPATADGRRIESEEEKMRILFDAMWLTQEELQSWGFEYLEDVPQIQNGVGYGIYNAESLTGILLPHENFGHFLGFFRSNGADRNPAFSDFKRLHDYDLKSRLCTWDNFLSYYCQRERDFSNIMESTVPFASYRRLDRTNIQTAATLYNRAQTCINAYTSCTEAAAAVETWQSPDSLNVWRD